MGAFIRGGRRMGDPAPQRQRSSHEPAEDPGEAVAAGGGAGERRGQEGVEAEAAASVGEEEEGGEGEEHGVGPAPLVGDVQDAEGDVGGHAEGEESAEAGGEAEDEGDGDGGFGDEGEPAEEGPVGEDDVELEVVDGGEGGVLEALVDPVPEAAAGLAAEVVSGDL